ncbi:MAG: hypothetical protein HY755_12855 [Nitrospirae bacterium]|nr:hypothetical protein [Nitrospirota bacterium]
MKILKGITLLIMIVFLMISIGCTGAPVRIDSIPQRPIDTTKGRVITSSACGFQLFLLIPIMVNSRQERAYESLRMAAGSDYMTDVKIKESWTYGLVGTAYCTDFEATAYPYMTEK